ncbi:class I SAM-dependent methyltransferase [Patescibacteria group bacterium]|nr:class I SAM-dependent methyltransferase [Patescibacteria group bacterium]
MRTIYIKFYDLIAFLLKQSRDYLKADFQKWYTKTYQPEQETRFTLEDLSEGKELDGFGNYIWYDCSNLIDGLFLFFISASVVTCPLETLLNPILFLDYFALIGMLSLIFLPAVLGIREQTGMALKKLLPVFWDHPDIQNCKKRYLYFYLTESKEIVFTDKKPFFIFSFSGRRKTSTDWSKAKKNSVLAFMQWLIMSTLYLRFFWPYFFNPIQGAFLEYDRSAKKAGIKKNDRILVIGAGAVPHHMRWKNKIGSGGDITALDLDPYVIKNSLYMERFLEWIRSFFGKNRWVSKHICADSDKIPFKNNSFDVVIAVRCYYVNVEEALRVLKPEGKLVISTCGDVRYLDDKKQRVKNTLSGWIITA